MLITLQVEAAQLENAQEYLQEAHADYYGQPHGFRKCQSQKAHELFNAPIGALNYGYNVMPSGVSGWITSGNNIVILNANNCTVTYVGTRHGSTPLWVLDNPKSHKILKYESSMPFLSPFETLANFASRARLDSKCPIARGLALLNSGKPVQFLHAEGLPVPAIQKVFNECLTRGYLPAQ